MSNDVTSQQEGTQIKPKSDRMSFYVVYSKYSGFLLEDKSCRFRLIEWMKNELNVFVQLLLMAPMVKFS